ncbi:MAG TPA: hypothetical protein VK425_06960, partial [Acidimicrobiales bacterium]|nr:hypothetical protein [Acidimicrobiales bacterium]
LPLPLEGAVALTLEGHIYVAGGRGPAGANTDIWGFEPVTKSLLLAGHLAQGVWGAGAAALGGTAWLVGGEAAPGHLVGTVQTFRLTARSTRLPVPGSSPPTAAKKSSLARSG